MPNPLVSDYGVPVERVIKTGFGAVTGYGACSMSDFDGRGILYIGKGDFEKKGGHVLLAAFKIVRAAIPEATLDIVGQGSPAGDYRRRHQSWFRSRSRGCSSSFMRRAHGSRCRLSSIAIHYGARSDVGRHALRDFDYGAMPELLGDAGYAVSGMIRSRWQRP